MARVTAAWLRSRAREAMLAAGGRGFMRFLPTGGALLVTDAIRRCEDDAARAKLEEALMDAGFACAVRGGLLELTPTDDMLTGLGGGQAPETDWASTLHPAQALGRRWLANERLPLTAAGRQLIMEALRLTWQPEESVLAGLDALRAQAAVMQRRGDRSGLHEAGAVLRDYCDERQGAKAIIEPPADAL